MSDLESIKNRMTILEKLIRETRDRLPAHSTKPPVMMELLDYEDEYEALMKQYKRLKAK